MRICLLLVAMYSCIPQSHGQNYYDLVHTAEMHILEYEYKEALEPYRRAFTQDGPSYLKDLHNALLCAIEVRDSANVLAILEHMTGYNLDSGYLESAFFDPIRDWPVFEKLLGEVLESAPDSLMFPNWYPIYEADQEIRRDCKKIATNYYAVCEDTIRVIDSINLLRLDSLIVAGGPPLATDIIDNRPGNIPTYFWVISHNAMWCRHWLDSILIEGIEQRWFHPQLYAHIWHGRKDDVHFIDFDGGSHIIMDGELYIFDLDPDTIRLLNARRAEIQLDGIEEHLRKIRYQFFNPEFKLLYGATLFSFDPGPGFTEELKEKWKEYRVDGH